MTDPAGMSPLVFAAVLAAAAMHAGWNAVLKIRLDPFLAITVVMSCAGVLAWPLLAVVGWPRWQAMPWVLASVVLHLTYSIALSEAYRRADMGQAYPIARGSAPLVTTVGSLLILDEPLNGRGLTGIALLAFGIGLMALRGGRSARLDPAALAYALLTALAIASYTLVDGVGARRAGDPHAYSAALFALEGVAMGLVALWRRGPAELARAARFALPGLAGGAMSLGSYWIAIWAMTLAPIALVAALRETSVLFGALIAVVVLKEPPSPVRIAAAALTVCGLVLIRLQ
ncbi:EamA family transporter [Chelatococcus sp. SYSU_G07232]|uniref:EamA family transporter n=1 Tax=Chelatococcus albus TaxID=3047466 RepID=A0ABT7AL14_9HYPH|nr:EamA family transporter [Chelatococcus sp. SYSU_G07232]MDJ1160065.1 EamA family transporter [Chelatococcus sp. SYSU_G07232]